MESTQNELKPKISVIVPVYNTQEFLRRCLDSICRQTLRDLEIIVINDGSTDDSADVIMEYAKRDSRIVYIEKENTGLGLTRNRGIHEARGEYLAFVDSDDYIEPAMLGTMYEKAIDEKLDILVCQVYVNEGDKQSLRKKLPDRGPLDLKNIKPFDFFKDYLFTNTYSYNAWDKIYSSSFIKDNGLGFGDNKELFAEDLYMQFNILLNNPVINFIPQTFCHYEKRAGSITGSLRKDYMKRHLSMTTGFYQAAKSGRSEFYPAIDVIFFRGFMNEANYAVRFRLGMKFFRKSCRQFYDSPVYGIFMSSTRRNRSHELITYKKRKAIYRLFVFLNILRMRWLAEWFIYTKFKFKRIMGK